MDSPRLPTSSERVQKERTKSRGILRSSSSRAAPSSSERPPRSAGQAAGRPTLRKAESTRVRGSAPPRAGLSSQGKAASVCERLDSASATLPRASSVISTAEGSTRRTSIHDLLSKDHRQPVSVDAASPPAAAATAAKAGLRSQPTPSEYHPSSTSTTTPALPKSLSLPCHSSEDPDLSTLESFLGPSFTVESVFMDSIFSESAGRNLSFLSLNPSLVSNISGPPVASKAGQQSQAPPGQARDGPAPRKEHSEGVDPDHMTGSEPSPSPEDRESLWYEYGCV